MHVVSDEYLRYISHIYIIKYLRSKKFTAFVSLFTGIVLNSLIYIVIIIQYIIFFISILLLKHMYCMGILYN